LDATTSEVVIFDFHRFPGLDPKKNETLKLHAEILDLVEKYLDAYIATPTSGYYKVFMGVKCPGVKCPGTRKIQKLSLRQPNLAVKN